MVKTSYVFRDACDRGKSVYRVDGVDLIAIGALYDRLHANFAGLSLDFYDDAGAVCLPHARAKSLPDGAALQGRLNALSNSALHAYVVSLDGQHLAVLVDYAQQSARRGGPSFGSDIDGTRSQRPDPRYELMETENTKIKSVTIAENLQALTDKFKLYAWQWNDKDAVQLLPDRVSPQRMQKLLAGKLTRFVQRARKAKLG